MKMEKYHGCTETTGPIQKRRGVVVFDIPHSSGHYHFDPKFRETEQGILSRARRVARQGEPTVFFIRPYQDNIYDLAFRAFSLNRVGRRNVKLSIYTFCARKITGLQPVISSLEWQHIVVKSVFGDRR